MTVTSYAGPTQKKGKKREKKREGERRERRGRRDFKITQGRSESDYLPTYGSKKEFKLQSCEDFASF